MPSSKYLKLTIGDKQVQVSDPEQLPIAIDYTLEDPDNFQNKPSSQAIGITVPATLMNDIAGNTFRNPSVIDLTDGEVFRSYQPFSLDENGFEIMTGKAFLKNAKHTDKPLSYDFDLYGDNADWVVDMQDSTLFDFLQQINFIFSTDVITASWAFDGTDESLPYVFAPVRYRTPMGGYTTGTDKAGQPASIAIDDNMLPEYMKPSLSKYFILYWGFKKFGYKIQSAFFDSAYFRRQVMPWTWGNFLGSDGTLLNTHLFLAKSVKDVYTTFEARNSQYIWDLNVSDVNPADGGFVNNPGDYTYDSGTFEMKWTYNDPDYGILDAKFHMQIEVNAALNGNNSYINAKILWYKNGTLLSATNDESLITDLGGALIGGHSDLGIKDLYKAITVSHGDVISAKIQLSGYASKTGFARIIANVLGFGIDFFSVPLGGTINFQNYTGLKNYKFLDFFRGVIDEFNLSLNTDPINKVLVIEPTHSWSSTDDLTAATSGYFKNDFIDWNGKEDLGQQWEMDNYSDYNREVTFKYKDDSNDGILKLIQDRNVNILASGKYVFPQRFTVGTTKIENRFFAPTMHYDLDQWKALGTGSNAGISPQMVCMVPENVSNTSNSAADNTFIPKSCYYKGNITGAGAWKFNGVIYQNYPFMFAVNYKPGGENDPILSYSDERISSTGPDPVIGKGLLKRFYWQRFAIMRNGQWYNCWFRLKNVDVINQFHREYKSYGGHRWELIQITGYKPLTNTSTQCLMRKWAPVTMDDYNATYPSQANLLRTNPIIIPNDNQTNPTDTYLQDVIYAQLKCLTTDIPTI